MLSFIETHLLFSMIFSNRKFSQTLTCPLYTGVTLTHLLFRRRSSLKFLTRVTQFNAPLFRPLPSFLPDFTLDSPEGLLEFSTGFLDHLTRFEFQLQFVDFIGFENLFLWSKSIFSEWSLNERKNKKMVLNKRNLQRVVVQKNQEPDSIYLSLSTQYLYTYLWIWQLFNINNLFWFRYGKILV